ncbi:MAG: DUF1349 domain-containing protein [Kosmotogaceae bacterium]
MNFLLNEKFENDIFEKQLRWYNEPSKWQIRNDKNLLEMYTDAETDFWQKTSYGFEADNGHFLYKEIKDDFILTTRVTFYPAKQYDQSGLMVRFSKDSWIKTSVEYEIDEPSKLGAVVTNNGFSDWGVQDFPKALNTISLRIKRKGSDYSVEFLDSNKWKLLRLTHLVEDENKVLKAGIYACSPKGKGYKTEFEYITIQQL